MNSVIVARPSAWRTSRAIQLPVRRENRTGAVGDRDHSGGEDEGGKPEQLHPTPDVGPRAMSTSPNTIQAKRATAMTQPISLPSKGVSSNAAPATPAGECSDGSTTARTTSGPSSRWLLDVAQVELHRMARTGLHVVHLPGHLVTTDLATPSSEMNSTLPVQCPTSPSPISARSPGIPASCSPRPPP